MQQNRVPPTTEAHPRQAHKGNLVEKRQSLDNHTQEQSWACAHIINKINPKWITDLNVKPETTVVQTSPLGHQKHNPAKEQTDKADFLKAERLLLAKGNVKGTKRAPTENTADHTSDRGPTCKLMKLKTQDERFLSWQTWTLYRENTG